LVSTDKKGSVTIYTGKYFFGTGLSKSIFDVNYEVVRELDFLPENIVFWVENI